MRDEKTPEAGRDARERLLTAAIRIFAAQGFESASTRELARAAAVNISAIPYYFGSKEGLYAAVMRHIVCMAQDGRREKVAAIEAALDAGRLTHDEARVLLHDFIGEFAGFLLSPRATADMAQIMTREQIQPSPVFDSFYKEMMEPLHRTLTRLVAFLIGQPETSAAAILCAQSVFGQITVFKTHRQLLLRRMGWPAYGPDEITLLLQTIRINVDAVIAAHGKKDA